MFLYFVSSENDVYNFDQYDYVYYRFWDAYSHAKLNRSCIVALDDTIGSTLSFVISVEDVKVFSYNLQVLGHIVIL